MNIDTDKRFIDYLREFGGAVRAAGPAVAATVLAHLMGATGPAAIFGGKDAAGLLDLGLTAVRNEVEAVLRAARADVQLRGPEFEQKSLLACFMDHAVPIFADVAGATLARQTSGVTAGSEAPAVAAAPTTKAKGGRKKAA